MTDAVPDVPAAFEDNIAALVRLTGDIPGSELGGDSDVAWAISGIPPAPPFNFASRARFSAGDADGRIAEVLAAFRRRRVPMSWWVGPTSQPADLPARLQRAGLRVAEDAPAMACDLRVWTPPARPSYLAIERVVDRATWREAALVARFGFELPEETASSFEERLGRLGFGERAAWRVYLGRIDGRPVSTAIGLPADGVLGIYNVATIPEARGRGAGGAVTARAMEDGRNEGCRMAVLESSEMGLPVYRRLGFEERSRVTILVRVAWD